MEVAMSAPTHIPVLLREAVEALAVQLGVAILIVLWVRGGMRQPF